MDEYEPNTPLSELLEKYELDGASINDCIQKNKKYSAKDWLEYFSDTCVGIRTYNLSNNDVVNIFNKQKGDKKYPCIHIVFKSIQEEVVPKIDEDGNIMFEKSDNMLIPMVENIIIETKYDYYTDDLDMVKKTQLLDKLKDKK